MESTLANEISLVDSCKEDFEQVLRRPIETAPFIRIYPRLEGWEGSLRQIADLGASKGDLAHKET